MPQSSLRFLRKSGPWLFAAVFFAFCVSMTALREPALLQQAFVIALMVCAFGVLLFAFARPATALVVSGGLFLALNFLSVLKLRYLDSPLMPAIDAHLLDTSEMDIEAAFQAAKAFVDEAIARRNGG